MGELIVERQVYALFAQLLEYPRGAVAEVARACCARLEKAHPEAGSLVARFAAGAEAAAAGWLEETYTATFDLNGTCYPYVGYHLFGESYKRSVLLVGLKERYRRVGLDPGSEVPDHVALVLRFLSVLDDPDQARELTDEALLPALARMTRRTNESDAAGDAEPEARDADGREAYQWVLHALRLVLERPAAASRDGRPGEAVGAGPRR